MLTTDLTLLGSCICATRSSASSLASATSVQRSGKVAKSDVASHSPKSYPIGNHQNSRSSFDIPATASRFAVLAEANRNINKPRAKIGVTGFPSKSPIAAARKIAAALGLSVRKASSIAVDLSCLSGLNAPRSERELHQPRENDQS